MITNKYFILSKYIYLPRPLWDKLSFKYYKRGKYFKDSPNIFIFIFLAKLLPSKFNAKFYKFFGSYFKQSRKLFVFSVLSSKIPIIYEQSNYNLYCGIYSEKIVCTIFLCLISLRFILAIKNLL